MSYKTSRSMTLMGRSFSRGETIPDHVMAEIPESRLRSLKNTGLLRLVEFEAIKPEPEAEVQPEVQPEEAKATEGETCPECGKGPYKRLDRHMTTHQGA